jgi:hypothetical protein
VSTQFPDVPDAPGVPPVNRDPNAATPASPPALSGDDPSVANGAQGPQWGIYDSTGADVLLADSIISWRYIDPSKILNYPVEAASATSGAGFQSYNKVYAPFEGWMVATKGGTVAERNTFLTNLAALKASLNLYTVFNPDIQFPSANVKEWHLLDRTKDGGVSLVTVEILVEQVNEGVQAAFTSTKNPASQNPTNAGPVQGQPVTVSQMNAIINGPIT